MSAAYIWLTCDLRCSYPNLTPEMCTALIEQFHVYNLPPAGRINVAGLSGGNIERVAKAIDAVVRQ